MKGPIDIVIPWVDGDDPQWRQCLQQYQPTSMMDADEARYRTWDCFRYWFRAIEWNAPWVRTIHFVTFGHIPEWLNVNHPKLHIVKHEDFISEEYLPTFSSHTLELNLHRIPDLSEQFIYFNDDIYLANPATDEDFFKNGLPCDSAVFGIIKNDGTENFMPYIMLNMLGMVSEHFSKKEMLKNNLGKWFNIKYGKYLLYNLYLSVWPGFTGFRNFHTAHSYLKSTLEELWEEYPDILDRTCRNKFRSKEDVNQYLIRYWQLASGKFEPKAVDSKYVNIGKVTIEEIEAMLADEHNLTVCINDDPGDFDFEQKEKEMQRVLHEKFPYPSAFELKEECNESNKKHHKE
ncbi:stealth conserved region 3 domain-containing protein [Allofustis seminis]|uniref:stealth conserved region 3 domain-containing protein n=1 Tax=Allofustis seminis TaxID=166939 RepID=UPI000365C00A|nr:stealth conserved region 3 domain-containing protein [Allofustis seminis]